eukprot:762894-Hanusia_phi.AAC.2
MKYNQSDSHIDLVYRGISLRIAVNPHSHFNARSALILALLKWTHSSEIYSQKSIDSPPYVAALLLSLLDCLHLVRFHNQTAICAFQAILKESSIHSELTILFERLSLIVATTSPGITVLAISIDASALGIRMSHRLPCTMSSSWLPFMLFMCLRDQLCRPVMTHDTVLAPVLSDQVNVLLGSEAVVRGGPFEHSNGDRIHMLWMENWTSLDDSFQWNISVEEQGDYVVRILACSHFKMSSGYKGGSSPVPLELVFYPWPRVCEARIDETCGPTMHTYKEYKKIEHRVVYSDAPVMMQFTREIVTDSLTLPSGPITLKMSVKELPEDGELNLSFHSLELVLRQTLEELMSEKEELWGDTSWLRDEVRYGLFFHWNSFTHPLKGDKLSYEDAVNSFNVSRFVDIIRQSGANVIIFTTNWAGYHFPAPIRAIDRILPGRTTERDLIAEISEGLRQFNVRLILYYHYGKDDDEWFRAMRFKRGARNEYFWNCWCDIIGEIGNRYRTAFDGWWIDDGMTGYYPHRAPWRRMWRVLKAGNTKRVVGYNPWALPKPTELQELYAGEISVLDISFLPGLYPGREGVFVEGPQAGLHATFSSLLQHGDWTFMRGGMIDQRTGQMTGGQGEETSFSGLQIGLAELIWGANEARQRRALAVLNLLISQVVELAKRASHLVFRRSKCVKRRKSC